MEQMVKYFLDTYALVEIIEGNEKFEKFNEENAKTSTFNLYELYTQLIKVTTEEQAKKQYYRFKQAIIKYTDETIFKASEFKKKHNKRKVSYTDALGYALAQQNGLLFVTGDKEFADIAGVEFIKK